MNVPVVLDAAGSGVAIAYRGAHASRFAEQRARSEESKAAHVKVKRRSPKSRRGP